MADWRDRSEINGDVVFFQYASAKDELSFNEVFIWDLDKTYLDTKIDSLSGLLQTIVEKALNKKNVPGTNILLQNLAKFQKTNSTQEKPSKENENFFPMYFISASPPQMEERIFEKFTIDGIKPLGCFYKDNLANIHPKKFWKLTKQVGYKVQALMQLRARLQDDVHQICWGDDSESDATIYNLYSDLCAGRLMGNDARNVLSKLSVTQEQIEEILYIQSHIPKGDPVEKIYINLATDTDPDYYLKFGRRTVATYNTFQVACDLAQDHRIDLESVFIVAQDMIYNYSFTKEQLMRSFDEMIRRGVIGETSFYEFKKFFIEKNLMDVEFQPSMRPLPEKLIKDGHVYEMEGEHEPWIINHIDYLNDYR